MFGFCATKMERYFCPPDALPGSDYIMRLQSWV